MAVIFMTAYCNVLYTQLSCNLTYLPESIEQHDHHHDKDVAEHDHHHDKDVAEHDHSDSHKHKDSKDDNCCNDKTDVFFASQINSVSTSFEFKNTFFAKVIISTNAIVNFPILFDSKDYFSFRAPPPKIPDIRVFLHSFLI